MDTLIDRLGNNRSITRRHNMRRRDVLVLCVPRVGMRMPVR